MQWTSCLGFHIFHSLYLLRKAPTLKASASKKLPRDITALPNAGSSKAKSSELYCRKAKWKGRECYVLGNGLIRLTALTGGGHIAEIKREDRSEKSSINPLWNPPWETFDSYNYDPRKHAAAYGPTTEGKLLAGLAGHILCMDYFGLPSSEEASLGLSLHGEAPNSKWDVIGCKATPTVVDLKVSVRLPEAGLRFTRELSMHQGESVVYFEEAVSNRRKADHFFHWTQHVTLGPPFINREHSRIVLPGSLGLTFPHGYDEGKVMLRTGGIFRWPHAPSLRSRTVDLTRPFSSPGRGYVAGVLLDKRRNTGFVAAQNRKEHLIIGYCFLRSDFPWVTIWEENLAIQSVPWKGRTQALGLEFGTTPLPVTRRENFIGKGALFGEPTLTIVPARMEKLVRYLCFLAIVPERFGKLRNIRLGKQEIVLIGSGRPTEVRLKASGLDEKIRGL
jgi:hypothetical protein